MNATPIEVFFQCFQGFEQKPNALPVNSQSLPGKQGY
jgi:hypothetical protein